MNIQLIPDIKLLPDITLAAMKDTVAITFFMNIAFVAVFIILLLLFIFYGTFRKIRYSDHYGRGFPSEWHGEENGYHFIPYTLRLNLRYKGNFLPCLALKIEYLFVNRYITTVKVKNPFLGWYIIKRNSVMGIGLSEDLCLLGMDTKGQRIEEVFHDVFIPIKEIQWISSPLPEAIKLVGNRGDAFMNVVRMCGQPRYNPPRYVEVMPSVPELEETV